MNKSSFYLKDYIGIGEKYPIRINLNFGINNKSEFEKEKQKIDYIFSNDKYTPDISMDLSTVLIENPLYKHVIDKYNKAVGIVPIYTSFSEKKGINISSFLKNLELFAIAGISFFTLHLTADTRILKIAKATRKIPVTSRGGGIVLKDQIINKRKNVLLDNLDDIISICLSYNIAISLGTTFRPASTLEACDQSHLEETLEQLKLCDYIKARGVNIIVENVGHISLDKMEKHFKLLKKFNSPIMPLGPLPTDIGLENDHIVSAIGSSFMGYNNCAHIFNCITPAEHVRSNVTLQDMKDGISAAKISAHIVNLSKKNNLAIEKESNMYEKRFSQMNCLELEDDCSRCANQCPLRLIS